MLFALSVILVFILSFAIIFGLYLLTVSLGVIKKKKIEKLLRLVLVYSIFITLVYVFKHLFV